MFYIGSDFLLERLSKRERNLLFILIFVVIVVILFQFYYVYYWQQYKAYQEEIITKTDEKALLEEKIERQDEIEEKITEKELLLDEKKKSFQYNLNSGAPWVQIDKIVAEKNLSLLSAQPQEIEKGEIYSRLPLSISLEGSKNNIAAFIKSLENLRNLWVVENIIMERDLSENEYLTSGTIEISLYGSLNDDALIVSEEHWPSDIADEDLEELITEDPITDHDLKPEDDIEAPEFEPQFIYRDDYSFPIKTGGN